MSRSGATRFRVKDPNGSVGQVSNSATISDGSISYLHTAVSHAEGGYEVDVAPLAYRYPGRFQAQCEQIALDTTQVMLKKLWS